MATGRDEKGRLLPGHPFLKSQKGIKNGRKKTLPGKVKDALQIAEDAMPQLFLDMIEDAQNMSISVQARQQCREYLADRIYGKPTLPLGLGDGKPLEIIVRWATEEKKDDDV